MTSCIDMALELGQRVKVLVTLITMFELHLQLLDNLIDDMFNGTSELTSSDLTITEPVATKKVAIITLGNE
ncbi:hypothetical protein BGZ96_002312 [Linnemannia gamsii]|uniref:Uncharacterized protein n=1 Tax=Linnemannia gamsii TaxID=64522 RepID=A0ABQ7K8Z3_9FUNG|nr:hypothetical protein BGZ96_002312 [Linnemannia gamsii]